MSSFPNLEVPADVQKLKKHIALLCDRISKGFSPTGNKSLDSLEVSVLDLFNMDIITFPFLGNPIA